MRAYRNLKDLKAHGKLNRPGQYAVGPNLYIQVSKWGTTSWVFRFTDATGKLHRMGLGPFPLISLTHARAEADKRRLEVYQGGNPLAERTARTAERRRGVPFPTAGGVTFKQAALDFIESNAAGWRNGSKPGSAREWRSSLETDAFPLFGDKAAASIDVADIKQSLGRIVARGALESAHRFRGRL